MAKLLTDDDMHARLIQAIAAAGGQSAFARLHGTHQGYIANLVSRHRRITATVGAWLGCEPTSGWLQKK